MKAKNTICLWYDKDAEEAARFYAATFANSQVTAVHTAPSDYPGGKKGDVLTVEFTVVGIPCLGLNGGPQYSHTEAFSFQIATDTQEETDRYWNAIVGNGGKESHCHHRGRPTRLNNPELSASSAVELLRQAMTAARYACYPPAHRRRVW